MLAPQRRQAIEPGPLAFVRWLPGSRDPTFRLEAVKRRIQRPGLDLEQVFRHLLDVPGNGVSVSRSGKQRAKDKQIESTLQQADAGWRVITHYVDILRSFL